MTDAIMAAAATAFRADAEQLRIIADNIANAQTAGYRRQMAVVHTDFSELVPVDAGASISPFNAMTTAMDPRPASLSRTGEPFHVALASDGYFVVEAEGREALTRNGAWRLDAAGRLVTMDGHAVLGQGGAMFLAGPPTIDGEGVVRVGDEVIDRLRVINPAPEVALVHRAGGLLELPVDAVLQGIDGVSVRQGFLEMTNVEPVREMMQLMDATRHFETMQRLVRGYDSLLDKAITELGKV